jgi:hypothetical protein
LLWSSTVACLLFLRAIALKRNMFLGQQDLVPLFQLCWWPVPAIFGTYCKKHLCSPWKWELSSSVMSVGFTHSSKRGDIPCMFWIQLYIRRNAYWERESLWKLVLVRQHEFPHGEVEHEQLTDYFGNQIIGRNMYPLWLLDFPCRVSLKIRYLRTTWGYHSSFSKTLHLL